MMRTLLDVPHPQIPPCVLYRSLMTKPTYPFTAQQRGYAAVYQGPVETQRSLIPNRSKHVFKKRRYHRTKSAGLCSASPGVCHTRCLQSDEDGMGGGDVCVCQLTIIIYRTICSTQPAARRLGGSAAEPRKHFHYFSSSIVETRFCQWRSFPPRASLQRQKEFKWLKWIKCWLWRCVCIGATVPITKCYTDFAN